MDVEVPYNWTARDYQKPVLNYLEKGGKRAVCVWHRRAGKGVAIHAGWTVPQCFARRGAYWHVFPTYKQGRRAIWEGQTAGEKATPFRDYFPPSTIVRERDDEMTLWLEGGSMWSVIGSDETDRLVGANPLGVVFDEFSLQQVAAWQFLAPILAENGGWAVFIFTPRGHNHGWQIYNAAKQIPGWFVELLTVDDTRKPDGSRVVPMKLIEEERALGLTSEEIIQQEYWASFTASLQGSYYGAQMDRMLKEKRIREIGTDDQCVVHTGWDLGVGDDTAIWWFQEIHGQVRLLDCLRKSDQPLSYYCRILQEKREANNWVYGEHLWPHDAEHREFTTAKTRIDSFREYGFRARTVPIMSFADGIDLTRALLNRSVIDEEKCKVGIQALREYAKKETGRRDPTTNLPEYDDGTPVKNWTRHMADALRTVACGMRRSGGFGTRSHDQRTLVVPKIAML